ncbi:MULTISPECIES: hypothetical protein [Prauserella]|nr:MULTISPECIES: hypothetical protein [Prauserella]
MDQRERTEILEAAGFTVLGEAADVHGTTPEAATRSVANLAVRPQIRVDAEADDSVGRTEQAWRDNAEAVGLLAEDGSCYVCITGPGAFELPWALVRPPSRPGFLSGLLERAGSIDVVSIAASGSPVVGLFEEEDENWIINVELPR